MKRNNISQMQHQNIYLHVSLLLLKLSPINVLLESNAAYYFKKKEYWRWHGGMDGWVIGQEGYITYIYIKDTKILGRVTVLSFKN